MITQEIWKQWKPIETVAGKHYEKIILFDDDGFKIVFFDRHYPELYIQVLFETGNQAYRYTDESCCLETIYGLKERYGMDFYGDLTFFTVENSLYIKQFREESFLPDQLLDQPQLYHFAFVASNSIIDVIAVYEPKVAIVERSLVKTEILF